LKCGGKFRLFNHEDCQRWLCWCKAWACSAASRWGSDQNKSHADMLSVHIYIYSDCLVTFLRNWNFAVAQSLPAQAVEAPEQEAMREGGLQESPKAQAKSAEKSLSSTAPVSLASTATTVWHLHASSRVLRRIFVRSEHLQLLSARI